MTEADEYRQKKTCEYRKKIFSNITAIFKEIDELETMAAEFRYHLLMNDTYFFHHYTELQKDKSYGTYEDLVELFLDTSQIISRIEKTRFHLNNACRNIHFYEYKSNIIFEKISKGQEKHQ